MRMDEPSDRIAPARVFIDEWMEVRGVNTRLDLSKRMNRAPGTITKKLNKPGTIDLQWLAEFSVALKVSVPNLFADPSTVENAEVEYSPKLGELMSLAAGKPDTFFDHLIGMMKELSRAASPPPELLPEPAETPQQKEKSG